MFCSSMRTICLAPRCVRVSGSAASAYVSIYASAYVSIRQHTTRMRVSGSAAIRC